MLVIPAIDLLGGKCVRLTKGEYEQSKEYSDDPAEVAATFEAQGAQLLHVVDLDGAKAGEPRNTEAIAHILQAIRIPVQVGGGIRDIETAERLLDMGVERVILGSVLAKSHQLAAELFAKLKGRAIAGVDARNGRVAVSGWTETSDLHAVDFALTLRDLGAERFIVTDIDRDGTLLGPNIEFLAGMAEALEARVIASGGVSAIHDVETLSQMQPPLEGVIVGKALYEGTLHLPEALKYATVPEAIGPSE